MSEDMDIAIIAICVCIICTVILIVVLASRKGRVPSGCANICDVEDFRQLFKSIGFGRLYPYYTGMSIRDMRSILKKENRDMRAFEEAVKYGEMLGFYMGIELPRPPCDVIKRVEANLNRSGVVSSFSIELLGPRSSYNAIYWLTVKFGNPTPSFSTEFTIWRVRHMVISINPRNNTIYIIDERRMSI